MKAVILAAGVGSRLGRPLPKSLSVLPTGETIIGRQIHALWEAGVREVYVVVGFKKTLVMEQNPDVFYHYNPLFYLTNTAKSLLGAVRHLDDDVLWLNGDVVFDRSIIKLVLASQGNRICVDKKRCGDEEVKYTLDERGAINAISKIVTKPQGEAVGINLVRREDLPALVRALETCNDQDYFEMGLEIMINAGVTILPLDVSTYRCIEVDFEEDWDHARRMFAQGSAESRVLLG
ncbi:MAG: phosphocholine cytidylyltransferase family protein [Proteobacteria bacterium]|nr:phosphocholine cytidylyltransferase family protein [Pseudomonadota bacterium]